MLEFDLCMHGCVCKCARVCMRKTPQKQNKVKLKQKQSWALSQIVWQPEFDPGNPMEEATQELTPQVALTEAIGCMFLPTYT